jgi:hypothetical protein
MIACSQGVDVSLPESIQHVHIDAEWTWTICHPDSLSFVQEGTRRVIQQSCANCRSTLAPNRTPHCAVQVISGRCEPLRSVLITLQNHARATSSTAGLPNPLHQPSRNTSAVTVNLVDFNSGAVVPIYTSVYVYIVVSPTLAIAVYFHDGDDDTGTGSGGTAGGPGRGELAGSACSGTNATATVQRSADRR